MERKRTKIIMLPTDKASCIIRESDGFLSLYHKPVTSKKDGISQHFYFINDEEIREGDWAVCFEMIDNEAQPMLVYQVTKSGYNKLDKKIIATTDELIIKAHYHDETGFHHPQIMPQPSQAFIEKYCKVGGIDEVDVEYTEHIEGHFINDGATFVSDTPSKLKVDSYNTITIHPIKDSWNRDELFEKLQQYWDETHGKGHSNPRMINWLKEHLQ